MSLRPNLFRPDLIEHLRPGDLTLLETLFLQLWAPLWVSDVTAAPSPAPLPSCPLHAVCLQALPQATFSYHSALFPWTVLSISRSSGVISVLWSLPAQISRSYRLTCPPHWDLPLSCPTGIHISHLQKYPTTPPKPLLLLCSPSQRVRSPPLSQNAHHHCLNLEGAQAWLHLQPSITGVPPSQLALRYARCSSHHHCLGSGHPHFLEGRSNNLLIVLTAISQTIFHTKDGSPSKIQISQSPLCVNPCRAPAALSLQPHWLPRPRWPGPCCPPVPPLIS